MRQKKSSSALLQTLNPRPPPRNPSRPYERIQRIARLFNISDRYQTPTLANARLAVKITPSSNTPHASRGMNLFEILIFFAMLMCSYWGAQYGLHHFVHALWAIPAALVGFFVPVIALFFLAVVLDVSVGGRPRLPPCREGTCRGVSGYDFKKVGDDYHHVCKHGIHYQRRRALCHH